MSQFTRIHIVVVSFGLGLLIGNTDVDAASFECSKAETKAEKSICGSGALSTLDEQLADAYIKGKKRTVVA